MERTYILGDSRWSQTTLDLGAELVLFPETPLHTHADVHDFVTGSFTEDIKALILAADTMMDLCLSVAFHVRLSLEDLGMNAMCPIVFVSDAGILPFLKAGEMSQLFLTDDVFVCARQDLPLRLSKLAPLTMDGYRSRFLERINIRPPATIGNHSLANQWGASVLYRLSRGSELDRNSLPSFMEARKELYFKFIQASTSDLSSLMFPERVLSTGENIEIKALGKKVLLIDDEADKGWAVTLKALFSWAKAFDVIREKVSDYEEMSQEHRDMIEQGEYDLFILDLRLDGVDEEGIYDPEAFSGMKILRRIKSLNRGNQVIMFTASNKAWNFKALLDPAVGANGYYIKESPENRFPDNFSQKNYMSFKNDVERCFMRGYLRDFWSFKESVRPECGNLQKELKIQLDIAYNLAETATSGEAFTYAFLSAYQVFEVMHRRLTDVYDTPTPDRKVLMLKLDDDSTEMAMRVVQDMGDALLRKTIALPFEQEFFRQIDKLSSIYLQLFGCKDDGFIHILDQIVKIRNKFIHKDGTVLDRSKPISEGEFERIWRERLPVFSSPDFYPVLHRIARDGCLFEMKGMPVIDMKVMEDQIGIELLLACIKRFCNKAR